MKKEFKPYSLIVLCPPLSEYPEPLTDQSLCEPFDCPECKEKMWLSRAKKAIILFNSMLDKDIILACYNCIEKMAEENPSFFLQAEQVSI